MFEYKNILFTSGISLLVSSLVVLTNNFYLYKHGCKKGNVITKDYNDPRFTKIDPLPYNTDDKEEDNEEEPKPYSLEKEIKSTELNEDNNKTNVYDNMRFVYNLV